MTGIFDSGAGGLSVLRELLKKLPGESYLYFSDNAYCPYGDKSVEFVQERARVIVSDLLKQGCDIIVVACNTATAAAIASLRQEFDVPFVGMEPAVKPAVLKTRSGVVGVLATAGTLSGEKYHMTRDRYAEGVVILEHVGEGFVELVETACLEGPRAESVVEKSLRPLVEAGVDTIVMGCTHYPFLSQTLAKVASSISPNTEFTLVDPAPAVARRFYTLRKQQANYEESLEQNKGGYDVRLQASGSDETLRRLYDLYVLNSTF